MNLCFSVYVKLIWLLVLGLSLPTMLLAAENAERHPIYSLAGEKLEYDISFLWFDRLAEGQIRLERAEKEGIFTVTMEAKTLGIAAFFTRNRVEKFQTLMRIAEDGYLIPIRHSSHTIREKKSGVSEKVTSYFFDYEKKQVRYHKIKNNQTYSEQIFEMSQDVRLYDILTALYNLRLGLYGEVGTERILIPTFHKKGPQDIVVEPLTKLGRKDRAFFANSRFVSRILVDPSVFGTKGRDIYASFDEKMKPTKGIIKDVIGLGDVRGILRNELAAHGR